MGNDGRVLVDCGVMAAADDADDASPYIGVAASKGGARGWNCIVFGVCRSQVLTFRS